MYRDGVICGILKAERENPMPRFSDHRAAAGKQDAGRERLLRSDARRSFWPDYRRKPEQRVFCSAE
jgi:hypothetical protein